MSGSAVREIRSCVQKFVARHNLGPDVCVALSGGTDSLALTAAACGAGLRVRAIVVDHQLQRESAVVAEQAADAARGLGAEAVVVAVNVDSSDGLEAGARVARYGALDQYRDGLPTLVAHTLDDQAETVLLGLARGSGLRSIAGMREWSPPWGRPLLGVRRSTTAAACAELGLAPHTDPHNSDPRFTRVRMRTEVLPLLEDVCQGGVAQALARTARLAGIDSDYLDEQAAQYKADIDIDIDGIVELPLAVRSRVVRQWLTRWNPSPTASVLSSVEALISAWHGQGGVAVAGDCDNRLMVTRRNRVLTVISVPRKP